MLKIKVSGNSQGSNPITPCSNHNAKKKKKKKKKNLLWALWRVGLETTGHKITGWRRRNRGFKQRWMPHTHTHPVHRSDGSEHICHCITYSWENGRLSTTCIQWQLTEWNCEPAKERQSLKLRLTATPACFSMHTYTCFTIGKKLLAFVFSQTEYNLHLRSQVKWRKSQSSDQHWWKHGTGWTVRTFGVKMEQVRLNTIKQALAGEQRLINIALSFHMFLFLFQMLKLSTLAQKYFAIDLCSSSTWTSFSRHWV